ncbi:energy-coupling factor ABC transporter permease [Jannaschia sp. R86511]|uniref:energy-coupling factor ABC transporter permease n=1 Tax=Jannaschia sp. R86511 TaxID=3093853 RepID=UPI0036D24D3B
MHVPDGFLDVPTSIATGVVAAGVVAVSLRRARDELAESTAAAPMAGLVAAFVFAVQMLNFPVGVGTSGHLMGGALAAVLVGPWTAIICLAVVVTLQALLFADGGVSALGSNVFLIGIVTVVVGYAVARGLMAVLPKRPASAVPAAAVGALVSVPATALVFVGLYAVGGAAELDLGQLTGFMLTWHVLIGIGEAVITGLTVGAVVATRPDLVRLTRGYRTALVLTDADGTSREVAAAPVADGVRRIGTGWVAAALGVCLVLAGLVSSFASANPDGLEYVAGEVGFLETARDSVVAGSPFGDYAVAGIDNPVLATGLAGVLGVAIALAVGVLIARAVRPRATGETARDTEKV